MKVCGARPLAAGGLAPRVIPSEQPTRGSPLHVLLYRHVALFLLRSLRVERLGTRVRLQSRRVRVLEIGLWRLGWHRLPGLLGGLLALHSRLLALHARLLPL